MPTGMKAQIWTVPEYECYDRPDIPTRIIGRWWFWRDAHHLYYVKAKSFDDLLRGVRERRYV